MNSIIELILPQIKIEKLKKRKRNYPTFEKVLITDIGAEGKAIAKIVSEKYPDGIVVFVPKVIPGDVIDIRVINKRKSFMEGVVTKFHEFSGQRIKPFCEHFELCGGCKWQNLPYEEQLRFKQKQVVDNLQRIAKIELPEVAPILAAPKTTLYRNKLEYTFSVNRWMDETDMEIPEEQRERRALGFHIPKRFDKILDINYCHLQPDPSNQIRLFLKKVCFELEIPFYDQRRHEGQMRNVIIRTSSTGEVMVVVIFYQNESERIEKVMSALRDNFPEISSLNYVVNTKKNDSISDLDVVLFAGNDSISEQMEGLKFKIGPKSFYQTNSEQAYNLYKITREFAKIEPEDTVYDLYTGTGTIANFVARSAKKVIGIEYISEAIEDANFNSSLNKVENTLFFAGDMKDVLVSEFIDNHGVPDVIITDPPRAGMHKDVVGAILNANAKRIVYVSCNPATQARDIEMLSAKYKVTKVQPVDMFPHTHHVENVVLLEKK